MTVHTCRDLVIGANPRGGWATGSYDNMWALAVFLQGVLLYEFSSEAGQYVPPAYTDFVVPYYSGSNSTPIISQVSSSIITINSASCFIGNDGVGSYVQFSTDTVNLMSAAFPLGYTGATPWPFFSVFAGNTSDIFTDYWIAIRSAQYPLANSGIFQITSQSLSQNRLYIDYRSSALAFPETGSYVTASIWLPSPGAAGRNLSLPSTVPDRTGIWSIFVTLTGNGNPEGYQTQGSSDLPRMILTSPHPTGWQVRLTLESLFDRKFGFNTFQQGPTFTVAPGTSGSSGDFMSGTGQGYVLPSGALHLHAPQWYNTSSINVVGSTVGLDPRLDDAFGDLQVSNLGYGGEPFPVQWRFFAWGDDATGTCLVLNRNSLNMSDGMVMFGLPEDETQPLPPLTVQRLFMVGQNNIGGSSVNGVDWQSGASFVYGCGGMAYSMQPWLGPVSCVMSTYSWVAGDGGLETNTARFDAAAGDTPFLSASELISADLVAGTWDNMNFPSELGPFFPMEPRRMGRVPFARFGHTTGSTWTTIDQGMTWFHATNGFYLPWGGIPSLP